MDTLQGEVSIRCKPEHSTPAIRTSHSGLLRFGVNSKVPPNRNFSRHLVNEELMPELEGHRNNGVRCDSTGRNSTTSSLF